MAVVAVLTACTSSGASVAPSVAAPASQAAPPSTAASESAPSAGASVAASAAALSAGTYKIGYSNGGGVGNGFREEQVCTAKAQWAAYGGKPRPARPRTSAT
jgi:hypothetical protein